MLETLNLCDVKYIDELADSDDEDQQDTPAGTVSRNGDGLPRSTFSAITCRDALRGQAYAAISKAVGKTKHDVQASTAATTSNPAKPFVRTGARTNPPNTLHIQQCVDRSVYCASRSSGAIAYATKTELSIESDILPHRRDREHLKPASSLRFTHCVTSLPQQAADDKELAKTNKDAGSCTAKHRFVPRHADEVQLERGDAINMEEEYADLWCKGINLRSGLSGIFPSVCLTEPKESSLDRTLPGLKSEKGESTNKDVFVVRFLGSVETKLTCGNDVLVDAVRKVTYHLIQNLLNRARNDSRNDTAPLCRLRVSPAGIQLTGINYAEELEQSSQGTATLAAKSHDVGLADATDQGGITSHFFSFRNITYSGRHPENNKYMGFITKHPTQRRYACHCLAVQEANKDARTLMREILLQRLALS